ncbi:uncharacterized protein LOC112085403 [Eutrema salsugineum]|uniref:uncharacterized protein LOC112085403 n=1 Tax=Eutrema salsugineum TaxID=72664 RepID=UPI000CED144C|nr:uncharacterized protein LOC112085403 [Eutrema salsugineum]
MVSKVRSSREQPNWIGDTLWEQMNAYWNTEEAREKSATTSGARMSERKGLGPHIHYSGQKSYLQIQQEMEEELGRPVSLGEVFIKTHTKADGTFVDRKAQSVAERYQKNLEARMSELRTLDDDILEEITVEEENDLFLQVIRHLQMKEVPYGIGSLSQSHVNGKRTYPGSPSTYQTLQEQLEAAHRKIENKQQRIQGGRLSLQKFLKCSKPRSTNYPWSRNLPNDGPMTAAPENAAPSSSSNPTTQPSAA